MTLTIVVILKLSKEINRFAYDYHTTAHYRIYCQSTAVLNMRIVKPEDLRSPGYKPGP